MKAIRVHKFGGPEVLQLEEVPTPKPAAGQVLVKIHAAGVNPADTYARTGNYSILPQLPYTPGTDGAGTVESIGDGVSKVRPGDRVYLAKNITGSYAEYALALESQVYRLPEKISFAQGAGVFIPYGTAYHALHHQALAKGGETVLIHGASGGVGIAAIQIARAMVDRSHSIHCHFRARTVPYKAGLVRDDAGVQNGSAEKTGGDHEDFANFGGARERKFLDDRIGREFAADLFCRTGDDVEDAFGDAGALGKFGESERGVGSLRGGFKNDGAAGSNGRAGFAGDHDGGEFQTDKAEANDPERVENETWICGDLKVRPRHGGAETSPNNQAKPHEESSCNKRADSADVVDPLADAETDDIQNHQDSQQNHARGKRKDFVIGQRFVAGAKGEDRDADKVQQDSGHVHHVVGPVTPAR